MLIEKCFGLLKRRFPALRHGLRLKRPEDIVIMITAALVLHNMLIEWKDSEIDEESESDDDEDDDIPENSDEEEILSNNDAQNIRREIINRYFS